MNITAPKGTKDITGLDSALWQDMEKVLRRVSHSYNFTEMRTPIFEDTALFVRSIGEVTDIVEKEMYTFESKGGESVTLRPEGTASIVRSYLQHNLQRTSPINKLFYMGPMFRYERPQAGRQRQFHQFGVEASGARSPIMDVEVITLARDIFFALGLTDIDIRINSIGSPACRDAYRIALLEKITPQLPTYCKSCNERVHRNIFRVLDCKNPTCSEMNKDLPTIEAYLGDEPAAHFKVVQELLTKRGVSFTMDPTIVRGFDYYSNTVFEIKHHALGAQDAIGGGGRYDALISDLGGPETGAVGFAIGLERCIIALKAKQTQEPAPSLDAFVVTLGEGARSVSLQVIDALRSNGTAVDYDCEGKSMKAQMRMANRLGAQKVYILGEDEIAKGIIIEKNMQTSEQSELDLAAFTK